jgi:hypothetical protein
VTVNLVKGSSDISPKDAGGRPEAFYRSTYSRLLLVPLVVYLVWALEVFLFEGRASLFLHPDPAGILLYTLVTCILVGLVVPVLLIRRAFLAGAVNMHQLGFRSLRRTLLMAALTLVIVWAAVVLQNPFGSDRTAFVAAFLLLLPTGIASVMVCWVLIGTHVQALVRNRGTLISIITGTIVTGILFGLVGLSLQPGGDAGHLIRFLSAGILSAVFFFAVRDIWAASIAVTGLLAYLLAGGMNPVLLQQSFSVVLLAAGLMAGALAMVHGYLSRHYVTISAPVFS